MVSICSTDSVQISSCVPSSGDESSDESGGSLGQSLTGWFLQLRAASNRSSSFDEIVQGASRKQLFDIIILDYQSNTMYTVHRTGGE